MTGFFTSSLTLALNMNIEEEEDVPRSTYSNLIKNSFNVYNNDSSSDGINSSDRSNDRDDSDVINK